MGIPDIAVQPVDEGNSESAVRSLIKWASDREAEARRHLADHAEPDDASLIATYSADVIGYVGLCGSPAMPDSGAAAFRWFTRSRWPGRSGGGARDTAYGHGRATGRDPDIATLAITWVCSAGTARLSGCTDDDLTIWLTKDLVS
jgi:hypothetical protein